MVITTVSKAVNAGNAFKYSAINPRHEIRILILEPGTERDKIKCNLVHASLTDRPYEALSYEWGFQQEGEPEIILDGFSRRVRNNLFNALRQIRPEDGARHLWTDALCINEADGEEKGHQVQLMGEIYRNASAVLVWHGLQDDDSTTLQWNHFAVS